MKKLAVLISDAGTGTNLQAIIDAIESDQLKAKIAVVVSDTTNALGLKRAKKHHLPILIINKKDDLVKILKEKYQIDYVCLAGWKKIIPKMMIDIFKNKIFNIHPGLIPDHLNGVVKNPDGTDGLWNRGKLTDEAIQNFLDHKATYAGSSVHFLSKEFDFGPVLARCFEKILSDDTIESLYSRLKKKEHQIYIQSLKKIVNNYMVNVLIIGSGGREHTLGWKIKQSPKVVKLYFAPGNAGTASFGKNIDIQPEEIDKLLQFAKEKRIDLTVVGPEIPLALGIVDLFNQNNLKIFGPTKKAAQLESSKVWAVRFMERHNIPHPKSKIFNNYKKAVEFIKKTSWLQMVVKASGLAAGKGVVVCNNKKQAIEAVKKIMVDKEFGEAGGEIAIQEKLSGQEVSILAFSDGKSIIPLLPAQDHKQVFDNDRGSNTGGMGAYAPAPFVDKKSMQLIKKGILQPTIDEMRKEKNSYKGILYAGLMLTKNGPKVLEFNVRFGDPETQPLMMILKSSLLEILTSCIDGGLQQRKIKFKKGASVCVVLASGGYPGHYDKGEIIYGLDKINNKNIQVFHAGTIAKNGQLLTNGGRVLGVTSYGKNIKDAIKKAYSLIGKQGVYFKKIHYRKDIGKKALNL